MKLETALPCAVVPAVLSLVLALAAPPAGAQSRADIATAPTRFVASVKSKDGTTIAYERSGQGPVLILVASALSDRSDTNRLAALLAPSFTVVNYDRRGRGESGDSESYAVEREIEDIDALVEAAGGSAFLFGSSSGAVLALEASNILKKKVKAQVLFEPPFIIDDSRTPIPEGFFEEIGRLLEADRRGDAVALFMTKAVGVPDEMVAGMRHATMWAAMEKRAHTLLYDGAIMAGLQAGKPLPRERWTSVSARTLVIDGGNSDAFLRNAAAALVDVLPNSRRHTLEGQDHSAVFTAPGSLAPALVDFLASSNPGGAHGKLRMDAPVK